MNFLLLVVLGALSIDNTDATCVDTETYCSQFASYCEYTMQSGVAGTKVKDICPKTCNNCADSDSSNDSDDESDSDSDVSWDGPTSEAEFKAEILDAHNSYRSLHEATANMEWSDTLQGYAQTHANKLASNGGFYHSARTDRGGSGENLYVASNSKGVSSKTGKIAADLWYDEIKDYDFSTGEMKSTASSDAMIGHFTQMVWDDSVKLGCAWARSGTRVLVCCNYSPTGNWSGENLEHVQNLKSQVVVNVKRRHIEIVDIE